MEERKMINSMNIDVSKYLNRCFFEICKIFVDVFKSEEFSIEYKKEIVFYGVCDGCNFKGVLNNDGSIKYKSDYDDNDKYEKYEDFGDWVEMITDKGSVKK